LLSSATKQHNNVEQSHREGERERQRENNREKKTFTILDNQVFFQNTSYALFVGNV